MIEMVYNKKAAGSIISFLAIVILSLPPYADCQTIVWEENFRQTRSGTAPAGWEIKPDSGGEYCVEGVPGSVEKVLKINALCREGGKMCVWKRFHPCSGVVTVQWRFFESESGRGQSFTINNSKGTVILNLSIDTAGYFRLNDSFQVAYPPIVNNQWYKIKAVIISSSSRCDLYINDIPVLSEIPLMNPVKSVSSVRICCGGDFPGILHVTDFIITSMEFLPQRKVNIYLDRERQEIEGVGFCHEGNRTGKPYYIIDATIGEMIENNMSLFRDRFPGKVWEPLNDNGDPSTIRMEGFGVGDSLVITTLLRLKEIQKRGIKTILGIWDVADWMVSNPEASRVRVIKSLDEFAETVCAFLLHGKEKYGVEVDFVDVNESEVGINIKMGPAEYAAFIKKCAVLFARHGIRSKVNIGSTLKWGRAYIEEILEDSSVRIAGGRPSYHSYRGTGSEPNDNSTFIDWGVFREKIGRNIWCTETDYDAFLWQNPWRDDYRGIIEMAYNYWRVFYLARTSATAGWFWRPQYPSHEVHKAYMNFFEPGGKIVETDQNYPGIFTVAYKHPYKRKFVVQVLNASRRSGPVTFTGVPNRPITIVKTSRRGDRFKTEGTFTPVNHILITEIEAESFNTLYGDLE